MTRLGDVCEYRNESIAAEAATSMPLYISTDSMMPNRGPIFSSTLPNTGKVKRFQAGDTLVSNIRPYFKKIWRADAEGVLMTFWFSLLQNVCLTICIGYLVLMISFPL